MSSIYLFLNLPYTSRKNSKDQKLNSSKYIYFVKNVFVHFIQVYEQKKYLDQIKIGFLKIVLKSLLTFIIFHFTSALAEVKILRLRSLARLLRFLRNNKSYKAETLPQCSPES